jgi:hypothetical protein
MPKAETVRERRPLRRRNEEVREEDLGDDIEFLSPRDVSHAHLARWGIYGEYGTGKTSFLRSIPDDLPVILVNTATENIKPIRDLPNFKVIHIRRWDDMGKLYLKIRKLTMVKTTDGWVPRQGIKRVVIAFDTLSRLQALALRKSVGKDKAWDEETAWKSMLALEAAGKNYDVWDNVGGLVSEAVRNFDMLPVHCIWLMQENDREPKFEHSSPVKTGPMLTPKALALVTETLEMLGRLYVVESDSDEDEEDGGGSISLGKKKSYEIDEGAREVRKLFIGKHSRYLAKGNTLMLGRVVTDPTWDKLAVTLEPEE